MTDGRWVIDGATVDSISKVLPFVLAARAQMFPKLEGTAMPTDLAAFEATYINGPGRFLLARDEGEVVGVIGYVPDDRRFPALPYLGLRVVEVVRLFVLPQYRGAGLASALYQTLQQQAEEQGVEVMYLHTHPFLPGAQAFWERQGFELIAQDPDPLWRTLHMERVLTGPGGV
ncbi:GNAT family N-acetyltransferase [Pseudomonas sp. Marseille-Q5115]|uniref:GNAT family N-acetyltransferase n=1 Tax=Pseudomonas sp. Marseille-Q5115 TaxID=2866593 RepID=UPI001CE46183|nr:GNAT family N-acetyltransferase [Pseudomonas sp. Marseille-Q5115]